MTRKIRILILLCSLIPWMWAAADPIVTSVGSGSTCPGDEVVIPVTVTNCNGVAAISIALNFDNTKVSYQGYQNLNSTVSTMLVNASGGTVYMTWANMSAVNVDNGTLVELRFQGIVGSTGLNWNTNLCEYSDASGTALQANYSNGSINVYAIPSITSNPSNRDLVEGQSTNFDVGASGSGLSYQWQIKTIYDSDWQDLSNSGNHSNVNSWRLNVNNVTLDMNGNQYRCVVSGTCPSPVTSEAATLTVDEYIPPIPTIVTSTGSVSTCADQAFSIPVNVTNCNNVGAISLALNFNQNLVTYIGYENANAQLSIGTMRVNASRGTVYFTWASSNHTLEIGDGELISLVFRSASGNSSLSWNTSESEYSNLAGQALPTAFNGSNLNIYFPPSINSHPSDRTVTEGQNTNFSISASGQGLSYQWQMSQDQGISWENLSNGGNYSNVNSSTLYVNNVQISMEGLRYRCEVHGTCEPSVTSNYGVLHVQGFVPTIVTTAGSLNTCSETEFGIPISVTNCNNVGAISLTLAYNANILTYAGYEGLNPALNGGQLQVNAANGSVFIAWASIDGANVGNGNLITIKFTALSGTCSLSWNTAYCEYANPQGVAYPANYNNGNVSVGDLSFTITQQPSNQTVTMEESTTFAIATSGPTSGYQWQVSQDGGASWSNITSGGHYANPTTTTLSVNNVSLDMNGYRYRCVISGSCGVQYTSVAILMVQLPVNYYQITLTADPTEGGSTEGAGAYEQETPCTVTATPATGYDFLNWTENGTEVSTEASYTFTIGADRNLVAHFTLQELSIVANVVPEGSGSIEGAGTYLYGEHVLLTAIPAEGFVFDNWTENGEVVSTNQSISFTAQTDRNLVANFSVMQLNITAVAVPASNGSVEGAGTYAYGTTVTLTAIAAEGFELANWTENDSIVSTETTLSFIAQTDRNLVANFIIQMLHITAECDPEGSGTITGTGSYNYGDPVVLTATPLGQFEFYNWTEDGEEVSTQPTLSFNAYDHRNLVAHFISTVTIAVTLNPEESGIIQGAGTYNYADPVTLTATANTGYVFVNWMENDTVFSTESTISFTAYMNRTFVAHFDMIMHHVTVAANIDAGGTVSGGGDYQEGTRVTVTAMANTGFQFDSWTVNGETVSTNPSYTFTIWEDKDLVANFVLIQINVNASVAPSYGGSVTGAGVYDYGTLVTLTASPANSFVFNNWTENDSIVSTETSISFTAYYDRTFVANFEAIMCHVNVAANIDAYGTVSGGGDYQAGTQVTVTATPNTGFQFDRWTVAGETVSTNATYTFTIWEDMDLVANFSVLQISIYASCAPSDGGTVTGTGVYDYGSSVTLTAHPANNFVFDNWTENGNVISSESTFSFIAYSNRNLVANFHIDLPELHVTGISHSDFIAGQQVTVTWTVSNDGLAATPDGEPWYDRVWLSVENRVAADDNAPILLGEFANLSVLGPGEYYTQTQSFNLPLTLSGPYYLFVITDAYDCHHIFWEDGEVPLPYSPPPFLGALSAHCSGGNCGNGSGNRIYEQSEYERYHAPGRDYHDNFFYDYLTIEVPPLADLQVTSIIAPSTIYSGTTASVVATISNLGGAHTNVSRWSDALYVSQSETFDASAVHLGNMQHNGVLAPNESYEVTLTGTVPHTWYGEVYFYVVTDIYGQVYEHVANDNNVSRSQAVNVILSPPADLVMTDVTIPFSVSTGERLSVSYSVYNQGAGVPDASTWRDRVYLSTNPDELENPIELRTVTHYNGLQPNATYTVTESIPLPSSLSAGEYYVYVVTDADNQVFEYIYEDNNTMRSSSTLTVVKPDLVVTQIVSESTLTACYPASFSYTLQNIGVGSIDNLSVTDRLYMSPNADMSNAVQLSSQSHSLTLSNEQDITFNCSVQMPNLAEGTYYLFVQTDTQNAVNESNEENNRLSFHPVMVLHQPLPDLTPLSFALPSEIQAGTIVSTEFNVANVGDLDLINGNCAMNVYAIQNGQQILCPMQTQTEPPMGNITIPINGSLHFNRTILVPANVTSACSSFMLKVDAQGTITELDENNNTIVTISAVTDCPLPDLTLSNIVLPESVQAGATVTVAFDVNNIGEADLETSSLSVAVYANMNGSTVLCPMQSQIEPVQGATIQLEPGEFIHFVQTVLVPPTVEPTYNQFTLTVDPNNAIYETNDNNNSNTVSANVMDYPFDLALQSIAFPTEIIAGETYSVSWTVQNIGTCPTNDIPMFVSRNGNYYQAQSGNLPYPWVDKVYFSTDESISNDDVCVGTCNRTTVLNPDDSYTMTVSFTVPYTVLGNPYLIAATDCTQMTYDMNRANNTASQQVTVLLGNLPDLRITVLDVEPVLTADQTYTITYTVINEGDGATRQDLWKDVFYLGAMEGIVSGAFRLTENTHYGTLAAGETYEDSVEVTIPSSLSGDFFIIGFTDATSLVYEHDNEDDNVISVPVTVSLPLPCDLMAVDPIYPSTVVSGDEMTVFWTLFNTGSNPASGRIRDAVYLSVDNEWSSDDIMLGYVENNINLEANGQLDMELTATVQGIPQGSYYLVIKTNILHALNEASYENNTCVGFSPIEVDYPILIIGSSVDRIMSSNQMIYYKIEVGPEYEHQTLSCQLTTTSSYPGNGLYVAYESAPSMSQFDFSVNTPYEQNLEILIPSLEVGDYYLLASGSAHDGQPQNITLSASIINFEILHVNADHGSNTGSVTTQVIGARFDSIMDFRLVQGEDYMPAEKVFFSNSTESFVTFNLKDLEAGLYDVEAELPSGLITIKNGAFTIEEGLPAELSVNIIAPSSVRSGNTFTVNIEYGNIGTTDLNVSGLVVVSQNGHYVSLESEGLAEHETELYFDTAEPNGNPDVLRPGSRGTRTIFVKANNSNTVRISVYALRNIY